MTKYHEREIQLPEHKVCRACKGRHGSATSEIRCLSERIDTLEKEIPKWVKIREEVAKLRPFRPF